jgi:hypothetical protein
MKKQILVIVMSMIWFSCFCQENLNNISAPSSPASSILGIEPTVVLSPKSYQALETALYSNFTDSYGKGIIPNDFALEFTPYWTTDNKLSLEDYLYPESALKTIFRNSSISLASTQNFQLGDSSLTNGIGLGYRTTLHFGNANDREQIMIYKKVLNSKHKVITNVLKVLHETSEKENINSKDDFLENIKLSLTNILTENCDLKSEEAVGISNSIIDKKGLLPEYDKDNPDVFIDTLRSLVDSELSLIASNYSFENFETYIKERQGFSLDIAYAAFGNFPTSNFESLIIPNQSFWLTPSYRFKDKWKRLKLMGVVRYQWYDLDYYKEYFPQTTVYRNNIDYGFAISGMFKKFSIQFEALGRSSNSEIPAGIDNDGNELFRKDSDVDFQCIGSFNYNLTDQILLSYKVGNQFDPLTNPDNILVSQLTLNLGFGSPTKEILKNMD